MKTLVTYISSSGNTKALAQALYDGIEGSKDILPMDEVKDVGRYDVIFVGFPIIAKGAPRKARRFLSGPAKGKKVGLFITHGMPGSMKMLGPMLEKCKAAARDAEVIGTMDCQGKLAGWMASLFRLYPNAEVREWVRAGGESIGVGHPGKEDLEKAREFASRLTGPRDQAIVS